MYDISPTIPTIYLFNILTLEQYHIVSYDTILYRHDNEIWYNRIQYNSYSYAL